MDLRDYIIKGFIYFIFASGVVLFCRSSRSGGQTWCVQQRYSMSRKRRAAAIADDVDIGVSCSSSTSDEEKETSDSDASFDISSVLTRRNPSSRKGKAPRIPHNDGTDNDTELEEMIRNSISKRNVKDGTELLKNTKGKKKISKGELGGGSFQSMGTSSCSSSASHNLIPFF